MTRTRYVLAGVLLTAAGFAVAGFGVCSTRVLSAQSLRTAQGFAWVSRQSAHFDYFFEAGTLAERDIEAIGRSMEKSRAGLEQLLGAALENRNQVFVVDSRARIKALAGRETNGFAFGTASAMVYSTTINALGAHETCHNVARSLWGKPHGQWIDEGLAVYSDDGWHGHPLHELAKWLLDRNKLVPLDDLIRDERFRAYSDMVTYPELGSFVKYVYEKYGRGAVKTLWQRGAGEADRACGRTLNQLEEEWRSELGKRDASAIRYRI